MHIKIISYVIHRYLEEGILGRTACWLVPAGCLYLYRSCKHDKYKECICYGMNCSPPPQVHMLKPYSQWNCIWR
jgi:hypothetical protein